MDGTQLASIIFCNWASKCNQSGVLVHLTLTKLHPSAWLLSIILPSIGHSWGRRKKGILWLKLLRDHNSPLKPPDVWNASGLFQLQTETMKESHLKILLVPFHAYFMYVMSLVWKSWLFSFLWMAIHSWQCRMSNLALKSKLDPILLAKKRLPVAENYNSRLVLMEKKNVWRIKIVHIF